MTVTIRHGDCREVLRTMLNESVHCVVTSPPYFGLRDYGVADQIGLEPTPDAYVAELVTVFREVRRVLRSDGTFWLNLGDSYARNPAKGKSGTPNGRNNAGMGYAGGNASLPDKQRMMMPARVALALQADGWWLRDEIIWHKPNPMPASVTDRTTPAHEMLYMFAKSARYFYDAEAIKEPTVNTKLPGRKIKETQHYGDMNGGNSGLSGFIGKYHTDGLPTHRNCRSVWSITTRPFKGAHFATFPSDLVRRCILAGCPAGGTVLDPFGGAGTTGLVAEQAGRDAVLIELNPEYAEIARERIFGPATPFRFPWEAA